MWSPGNNQGANAHMLPPLPPRAALHTERISPASTGQGPASRAQALPADVRALALRVAGPVAASGIGDAQLAGDRVGLLAVPADDQRPVGQDQRGGGLL